MHIYMKSLTQQDFHYLRYHPHNVIQCNWIQAIKLKHLTIAFRPSLNFAESFMLHRWLAGRAPSGWGWVVSGCYSLTGGWPCAWAGCLMGSLIASTRTLKCKNKCAAIKCKNNKKQQDKQTLRQSGGEQGHGERSKEQGARNKKRMEAGGRRNSSDNFITRDLRTIVADT